MNVQKRTGMDWEDLRTFLAVSQALSFTRAAESLGIRQPTVSQHVLRLGDAGGRRVHPEKAIVANTSAVREWDSNGTVFGYNANIPGHTKVRTSLCVCVRARARARLRLCVCACVPVSVCACASVRACVLVLP